MAQLGEGVERRVDVDVGVRRHEREAEACGSAPVAVRRFRLWKWCRGRIATKCSAISDTDYRRNTFRLSPPHGQGTRGCHALHTGRRLGEKAKVILLAAPKAVDYYPRIGFEAHQSAWILSAKGELQ